MKVLIKSVILVIFMWLKEEDDLRIAVISHQIYPCAFGGLEVFNYYFIRELANQGHTIWVLTCCDYDWNNESIHLLKLWRRLPGLATVSIYFSVILNLMKLKGKIDLIHFPYTSNDHLAFPMLLCNRLFDLPYIITIHGGGMLKWRLKRIHKLFFKHAKGIIAVSEIIKKEYEKRSGRKIKVIPPLLPFVETKISKDDLKNKYGLNNDDVVILTLGSIKEIKGSDILLEAFLNLGKDYIKENNLKLVFVGGGVMRDELEEKIDEYNFSQYVKFFGFVPREKVSEMYKLADIYVIPSLFEGKPISLLEAMFNGLPIIGSNVNGINNLISDNKNGLLFERESIDDLKNKIIELVNDAVLSNRLGSSAKKDYSEGYVFENMILDHIKLYKEAMDLN